jgi:nucleoside-diphosphate-sugar epimerase
MVAIRMKHTKILITGANGFTGQHACNYFSDTGMEVTATVRNTKARLSNSIQKITCDLTQRDQIGQMLQKVVPDYVLHLAGRNAVSNSWDEPVSFIETNMMSTIYLLDALRRMKDCRVLVVGSMLDFPLIDSPKPPHPYSLSKTLQVAAAQSWGHLFGQEVMVAKPVNLIGPGYSNGVCGLLAKKIVEQERGTESKPFRLSSLNEERDFLDVRDAVKAYFKILRDGIAGKVYPIGSGQNRSLGEVIDTFQQMLAKKLIYEVGDSIQPFPPQLIDPSLMKTLDWQPSIRFETSLRDVLNFYRAEVAQ